MYRRWQNEASDKYQTLESYAVFLSRVASLDPSLSRENRLQACDSADLYAVLSVLHSKRRNPEFCASQDPGFYYFLADAVEPEGGAQPPELSERGGGGQHGAGAPRREAVVPVGSKSLQLTTAMLDKVFKLQSQQNIAHLLLAIVDDDGSVSFMRLYNYVQPPFEGPETLPALSAEGNGAGDESEDY